MKFTYEYRTSDNVRHEGVVEASDREAAFQRLKAQGIKPGRLAEAPGFFNKLFGKGKRWIAIGFLALLCLILYVAFFKTETQLEEWVAPLDDTDRRQVIGDTAIIEKGIRTGWSDVFEHEGERFLASFAIPGVPAGQRNTVVEEVEASLKRRLPPSENDALEARQIKAMVEGMKRELRDYVAAGGSINSYCERIVRRQDDELACYNRTKTEIESAQKTMKNDEFMAYWEKRNDELREMGIKLVPLPE